MVGASTSDSSNGGAGPEGGPARAVNECEGSAWVTSARYGSSEEGAGKYLEGKLWAEKGGGDSVAEDVSSWRALFRTFSRLKCASTSIFGGGAGVWLRSEGVVWTEEVSESTLPVVGRWCLRSSAA